MPTPPTDLPTACDPAFNIGTTCEVVKVGNSVDREFGWDVHDVDEETGNEICEWVPADFTGYVPSAAVLDSTGAEIATMSVSPAVGDDTGTFRVTLPKAEVTESLKASAVRWCLQIEFGEVSHTLILARFKVS